MERREQDLAAIETMIARLRRAHRGAATRLAAARAGWVWLLAGVALIALDAAVPLPGAARLWLAAGFIGLPLLVAGVTRWRAARTRALDDYLARRIEEHDAALGNDLVNALDFRRRLDRPENHAVTRGLMERAIERAAAELPPLRDLTPLRPPSLRREAIALAGGAAAALLLALIFGDLFLAVLPRYADPRGDHPPYSPTRIEVTPAGTRVDYGGRLVVNARTSRVPAREAALVVEDEAGAELERLPMFESREGEFFQTLEKIRRPLRYHVVFPGGRSRRFPLELNKTPRIESVSLTLQPPAWTRLARHSRVLAQPVVRGHAGGRARLVFESNRPLAGGTLTVGDRAVALAPDGERTVAGEFELTGAIELRGTLRDVEGLASAETWSGRVEIVPDEGPSISIASPGMDSFAIPDAKVPIVVEAGDDLGLREVALLRNVNGSIDFRKALAAEEGGAKFANAVETLDLGELGARPGDVISYYAVATDSNPVEPHSAATPAYQLAVISFEEYRAFMQAQMTAEDLAAKYAAMQEKLERLAKEQEELTSTTRRLEEKSARGEPLSGDERAELEDAVRRQQELARQTQALAEEMREEAARPAIFDIEESFKEELARFAEQIEMAAGAMGSAAEPLEQGARAARPPDAQAALAQAGEDQQAAMEQLGATAREQREGIEKSARELAQAIDLIGDAEKFKYLHQRQEALERQARYYRDHPDAGFEATMRMKELAAEQREVGAELAQLVKDLRAHAEAAQEALPKGAEDARRIADEIERRGIGEAMNQAAERLDAAEGGAAHPRALEAMEQMRAMMSECEAMGGEGGECEFRLTLNMDSRGMNMGQTLAQMRAGLKAGAGSLGRGGQRGDGEGGSGSSSRYGMFGSEPFGKPTRESRMVGGPSKQDSAAEEPGVVRAAAIEEIGTTAESDLAVNVGPGERVMEEYRPLIEAYFRGIAEKPKEGATR